VSLGGSSLGACLLAASSRAGASFERFEKFVLAKKSSENAWFKTASLSETSADACCGGAAASSGDYTAICDASSAGNCAASLGENSAAGTCPPCPPSGSGGAASTDS